VKRKAPTEYPAPAFAAALCKRHLGEDVCTLTEARGEMSVAALAAQTGISASHLSEIERGLRLPEPHELLALESLHGGRLLHVVIPIIVRGGDA
jgi:ribosome-binding protein aMBF1 (putative translation factor)